MFSTLDPALRRTSEPASGRQREGPHMEGKTQDFGGNPNASDSWRIFRIMAEFVEGFESLANLGPAVTVFGSARTCPGTPFYIAAETTGKLHAKADYAV